MKHRPPIGGRPGLKTSSKRSLAALLAAVALTPLWSASVSAQSDGQLLPCGVPVTRSLQSGDAHEYVVSIPPGETAVIDSGSISGNLVLLKVRYENDGGDDESCSGSLVVPGSAGVTTLIVSDCIQVNGESGEYTISASIVSESPSQCSRQLPCGIVPGGIETAGAVLPYGFTGSAGEHLNLLVTKFGSTQRAARLRLFDPSGAPIPGADSCNGSVRATLPTTGVYSVLVSSCGASAAGRFAMQREGESCPQGPIITYFGVARGDDLALQPDTFDEIGRPVFIRPQSSGFQLVIEARPGVTGRQPGQTAFDYDATDPSVLPDLQVLLSRPLGFGTPAVCDIVSPQQAGIPSTLDLAFDGSVEVSRAVNDLGCRFNNGEGAPVGRIERTDACTRMPVTLDFDFVDPSSTIQFCGPIAQAWAFAPGDTIVKARLRDNQDLYGSEREIVIRSQGESPFILSDVSAGELISARDYVYFSGQDAAHGVELWRTDGTSTRTEVARDIVPGGGSSSPRNFVSLDEQTFFLANAPADTLIWPANGLPINSGPVTDAVPAPHALTAVGNQLFFFVENGSGLELWSSSGENQDGEAISELSSQPVGVDSAVGSNGTFFFSLRSRANNMTIFELWRSDGTAAGTRSVQRFSYPTDTDARLDSLTDVAGTLFFVAGDRRFGYGLWTTDGSNNGAEQLHSFSAPPSQLTASETSLFFAAADGEHGSELWRSDGTAAGTQIVADINPGAASANVHALAAVGGRLFFAANDGTRGTELWSCGGNVNRAALVRDINPGPASSNPTALRGITGALYFSADDGVHGSELWISNGTESGTVLGLDLDPDGSGNPDAFTLRDQPPATPGTIVFRGKYGPAGSKLWGVIELDSIISPFVCPGDCNADDRVTVNELVTGVSNSLGTASVDECLAMDRDGNRRVTVNELVAAVNAALRGCVGS